MINNTVLYVEVLDRVWRLDTEYVGIVSSSDD